MSNKIAEIWKLVDAAGRLLLDEPGYCEICGAAVGLWPPEKIASHLYEKHRSSMWPQEVETWENYHRDTALGRQNFLYQMQYRALGAIVSRRADLFGKLINAGVVVATPLDFALGGGKPA